MNAEALFRQGSDLARAGQWAAAAERFAAAVQADPRSVPALASLGNAYRALGRHREAIDALIRANQLAPDSAAVLNNLGMAFKAAGDLEQAKTALQQACLRGPDLPEPLNNLANLFRDLGDLDRAEKCLRRAIALRPDNPTLYNNLGSTLERQGRVAESIDEYRRAIAFPNADPRIHGNLLYMMHFDPRFGPAELAQAHEQWRLRHAAALEALPVRHAPRRPREGRKLKVGYVSPDFRSHAVGRFMLPLLKHHDRGRFEVHCFSNFHGVPDAMTAALRSVSDAWHDIFPLPDDDAATLVAREGIDVLVDLTMHMAGNRMALFARRPAPVQITYLAYCGSTGLKSVGFRLSDPHLDPPGAERQYTERTIRLPDTYWCYEPSTDRPASSLPAEKNGFVTFGCLNNFNKISPPARAAWAEILKATPSSRLLLHAGEGAHRDRFRAELASAGVDPSRIDFENYAPLADYYALYDRVDLALDPFPYAGGTTTCDAAWMGVPTVTLAGRTAVGRGGTSILANLGLADWIARDVNDYVSLARTYATDLTQLSGIRAALRNQMQSSPLTDAPRFASQFERAIETAWEADPVS